MRGRWSQVIAVVAVVLASAAAVAVVGLALGRGSGGGTASLEDYTATVVDARDRVDESLAPISGSQSLEDVLAELRKASEVASATAADLDSAGVAKGFGDENDRLVNALYAFSGELSGTASTIGDPSFAGTLPHIRSLGFEQFVAVNRVLADLKRQGVDVDPLSTS